MSERTLPNQFKPMNDVADFWARHSDEGVDLKAKATSKLTVISIKIDPKYADAVPQMTSKEYEELKQSIKEDGLHYKLVVKYDGYHYILLDGHHRYKACQELGRQFIGIDVDPEECRNAEARIKLETGGRGDGF